MKLSLIPDESTKYRKPSQKTVPPKTDHKHEYYLEYAMMRIRRFDGTVSEKEYKFTGQLTCIDCGYVKAGSLRNREYVEIQITPTEFANKYRNSHE